jgi:transcriptional regulator with XRE-family HTH domain
MTLTDPPNRIREWRSKRRMSLAELGETVGLSRSEISKLESGSRRVRADHLVVLSKALKVPPEDLMDREVVREMLGELPQPLPQPGPSVPVLPARRQDGAIVVMPQEAALTVEAPPQIAQVPGAYAFYMPDTSLEPRVPVGALLFVNPLLPPRAGDLAVVAADGRVPALVAVERRSNALLAIASNGIDSLDLNSPSVDSAQRIAGMWFP